MISRSTSTVALLTIALAISGCKPDAALKESQSIGRGTPPGNSPTPSADAGSITGKIHFNGTPPVRTRIDMSMDPDCNVPGQKNDAEQYVVDQGALANVYVYIKSGIPPSRAAANTPPVVFDQKGCQYIPHVIALQQGGSIEIRNSDATMHTTHTLSTIVGNPGIDITQGANGRPQTRQLNQPDTMIAVICPIHPWMNGFINVAPSPYFAISAADGSFTIPGLPPGNYTLAAVHEKLGEQDLQISIPPKGAVKADFTYAAK